MYSSFFRARLSLHAALLKMPERPVRCLYRFGARFETKLRSNAPVSRHAVNKNYP
jgi:hypothetical protein